MTNRLAGTTRSPYFSSAKATSRITAGVRRALAITALSVTALGSSVAAQSTSAVKANRNSVAVLDFQPVDGQAKADRWALGLADFMTATLHQHGVVMLERRDLRYVLAERKLHRDNLTDPSRQIHLKLPWVKYLMRGQIRDLKKNGRFELGVQISEARTALEVARFIERGNYPGDLATAIERLAKRVAERLQMAAPLTQCAPPRPGFTKIPEVALIYFRAITHLAEGRPEFAIGLLDQALQQDPSFVIAKVWQVRAFERLGLAELADAVREDLASDSFAWKSASASPSGMPHDRDSVVISIARPSDDVGLNGAWDGALRRALGDLPNVQLLDEQWIKDAAADAFKKVLQLAQGKRLRLREGNHLPYRIPIDELAVERLERLRGNRTSVTPSPYTRLYKKQFEWGEASLAAGDYAEAIDWYYIVIRDTLGTRYASDLGCRFDVDYSVCARAKQRLRELRLPGSNED